MKIEFIFTYDHKDQDIIRTDFIDSLLANKDTFINFATASMADEEKSQLIKISSCIYTDTEEESGRILESDWFINSNGKLWLDDLQNWRSKHNINSTVSSEYFTEFYENL